MANGFSDRVLGAAGFGLCKAAISVAYITAMGSVSSSVGFVSELDFMFTMNAASFVTAFAVLLLVGRGVCVREGCPRCLPSSHCLSGSF